MKKLPGTREEDSWFSEEQLDQLVPAEDDDGLRSPIPTQMVSNGEYMPNPQTETQKRVELRIRELAEHASKKLGVSRRRFLASGGGMAAAFIAMNEAHGAEYFKVSKEEMFEPEAHAKNAPPSDLFVLDDQLHTIRSSRVGPGNTLRDIAQGNHSSLNPNDLPDELNRVNFPWNPAIVGLPNLNSNFHLVQFIKDVYLDSQVTIGILSNNTSAAVPGAEGSRPPRTIRESEAGEFLTAPQTASVRDWVNQIAGSKRMLAHGQLFPGKGNQFDPDFGDYHRWQIENLKPDSWKGYTSANSAKLNVPWDPSEDMRRWRLDDEAVAYPMYEVITAPEYRAYKASHPGFYNICIHKGLSTNTTPIDAPTNTPNGGNVSLGFPDDMAKAARDWPQLNFLMYHSCIRPGFWMYNALTDVKSGNLRDGVPDILWSTRFFVNHRQYSNVISEIGTTWASSVITFPSVAAHLLGQGLKYFGENRIVFGSDAVWYGAPQWQIEALWRFQIPEVFPASGGGGTRRQFGYPQLSETAKRKILGLNNARLYGIKDVNGQLSNDNVCGDDDDDRKHGRDDDDHGRRSSYHPVPLNYEALIPITLKKMMEFQGFAMDDKLSKLRREYLASDGLPSNLRHGWVRART
jgi:uncharacterized protein